MKLQSFYTIFFSCLIVLLPACSGKKIRIKSTAYSDVGVIPRGFSANNAFIVHSTSSTHKSRNESILQQKELQRKTKIILKDKGYRLVSSPQKADYCVVLDYGISSETKMIQAQKQTGKSSGVGAALGGSFGGGYSQKSEAFIYIPEEHTVHTKFINCSVYNAQEYLKATQNKDETNMPDPIWYGSATNINENDDLRECLDALLVTVYDLFGKSSQCTICLETTTENGKVKYLRKKYQG